MAPKIAIAAAVVTAACGGSAQAPTTPTVVTLSSVAVNGLGVTLSVGQTSQLTVTGTYSDGSHKDLTAQAKFASSNQAVASVSFTGLLTGWSGGSATITAEPTNPAALNFQNQSAVVTITGAPSSTSELIPTLLNPIDGASLPNNCPKDPCNVIWTFTWLPIANATAYHLNVIHGGASFPIVDVAEIQDASYQLNISAIGGGIIDSNLQDWHWMVQAKVNGLYQAWSPFNTFNVLPQGSSTLAIAFAWLPHGTMRAR
jgi:hypothetical protein